MALSCHSMCAHGRVQSDLLLCASGRRANCMSRLDAISSSASSLRLLPLAPLLPPARDDIPNDMRL